MQVSNKTRLYLSCSSSPGNFGATLYNRLFEHLGIDAVYLPRYCVDAEALNSALRLLGCAGCSISMPLKNRIIPYLDGLSGLAEKSQSVNTVVNQNGSLIGHNTDVFGAMQTLANNSITNVVIYGAGSVVSSIVIALHELGIDDISILSRRYEKSVQKASGQGVRAIRSIAEAPGTFDLLINATPAPFSGDLESLLNHAERVFDLVVSPSLTPLVLRALDQGKVTFSGVQMAMHQFQRQFYLYTGVEPDLNEIEDIIQEMFLRS